MGNNGWIYWRYEELFSRQQELLAQETFSEDDKRLIRRFQDHLFTSGSKQARVAKVTWGLRKLCNLLKSRLQEATKENIEQVVASIQRSSYADATKCDYKRHLKHFYRWYEDEDPRLTSGTSERREEATRMYKYLKKHVKTTEPQQEHDPGSILTNEDVQSVIDAGCRTEAERAFLKLLHETGCRIGEILGMRLKDIKKKNPLWIVRVSGKTGERTIPIRYAISHLSRYLDVHPRKKDPDAYLWMSENNRWKHQPLRYYGAVRLIRRCFKRAGCTKRHNPHWWRHSRASLDAPRYSESILCMRMGWVVGSSIARRYTHLSGKDVEDAMLKSMGLKSETETNREAQPEKCLRCAELNQADARFCWKCGAPCKAEDIIKEEEYLQKAFDILPQILDDPRLRAAFEKRLLK